MEPLSIVSAEFLKGAVKQPQFPQTGLSEFAFFGRSNAGKSSLINMLLNRKNLVKTGSRPGMTQEINFFLVHAKKKAVPVPSFCLADLPGYGYAQLPDGTRERINRMLYDYSVSRPELKTLFFLMDIRRNPTDIELNSIDFFTSQGIETVLVGTKADKIGKNEQVKQLRLWSDFFRVAADSIFLTSSSKKTGREKLLQYIAERIA